MSTKAASTHNGFLVMHLCIDKAQNSCSASLYFVPISSTTGIRAKVAQVVMVEHLKIYIHFGTVEFVV